MTFPKIISVFLHLIIGVVFLFSAISKLPSLEQFGWTIVETLALPWWAAEWLARICVGLELFVGVLFVSHIQCGKLSKVLSFVLLIFFTIYLLFVWKLYGNDGNCGCFGEWIPMTPKESIIKNLFLGTLVLITWKFQAIWQFRYKNYFIALALILTFFIPFICLPPESIYIQPKEKWTKEPLPLYLLYNSPLNKPPAIDLKKGKHVIAFMSLTCKFCRKAARRMHIMKSANPELPFYLVLNGDSKSLPEFLAETKASNIDYSMFNGVPDFLALNGSNNLPTIKWVQDTTVVRQSNYLTLDEHEILDWLNKKQDQPQ